MDLRRFCIAASVAIVFLMIGSIAVTAVAQNATGGAATPAVLDQAATTAQNLPDWAYPPVPANAFNFLAGGGRGAGRAPSAPPPDPGPVLHVPGSSAGYTAMQIRNSYNVADWFPEQHPPAPDIILHGDREHNTGGCGYCHLPNGFGRTENQSLAGLPEQYIIQQVAEIKSGVRKTSGPRVPPFGTMVREAQNATDEDVRIAAAYFASVKMRPWIRVVETDTVPVTKLDGAIWVAVEGGATEPIGARIVELAEDQGRFELRDASSGFVAYVPKGSIGKGKMLVTTGGAGKTTACTICHGPDLKGLGNIPPLAGRSPSQLARQIVDIRNGNRNGAQAVLMKPVVANLTDEDLVNITAYLASLEP